MNDEPTGFSETEVGNVAARLSELGLNPAVGICIVPSNLFVAGNRDELFVPPTAPDIKTLLRQAGVTLDKIEPEGTRILLRDDRDSTLILPILFFATAQLSNSVALVNVALGVVANYVTDYFRGKVGGGRVIFSVVHEKNSNKTATKISFDGPPEDFGKVIDVLKQT
jgi:hypothetical protein